MNLEQHLVLAYLEEDNVQRAYFRVKPLLTMEGNVAEEARQLWPEEGGLRIVPDRGEQHTFKERMRGLGPFCAMDLRGIPADAGKIRTNKNYRPDRGEINQYILYSDTVKPLPEHTFYEILEGSCEDAATLAQRAVTPLFYIREHDTLFGPVHRAAPRKPEPAASGTGMLYPMNAPDGVQRLMLCVPGETAAPTPSAAAAAQETLPSGPESANAEAPEISPEDTSPDVSLPLGQHLSILDTDLTFDEAIRQLDQPVSHEANLLRSPETPAKPVPPCPAVPLNGTPLFHASVKTSVPPPKNRLQEVVATQIKVGRYEPPTASLPAGTAMRQVYNPVETACESLRSAWQLPSAHNQLLDCIFSLDGMRSQLEARLLRQGGDSPLQRALQARLDELEAERLAALVQLDKARADLEAFRKSAVDAMSEKARETCIHLAAQQEACEHGVETLRQELAALTAQRNLLQSRVDELQQTVLPAALASALADTRMAAPLLHGSALRMNGVPGVCVEAEEMISRVMAVMEDTGASLSRNQAVALLVLIAVSPRISVVSDTPAAASTVLRNLAAALGWLPGFAAQCAEEQQPLPTLAPIDSTPTLLATTLARYQPLPQSTKLLLSRSADSVTASAAYAMEPWPILTLTLPEAVKLFEGEAEPVSAASLQHLLTDAAPCSADIDLILAALLKAAPPLSGQAIGEMHRFITACATWMDGGLAAACDWAVTLWLLPTLQSSPDVQALLEEYPMAKTRLVPQ